MDTTADPDIIFDENGASNYVSYYQNLLSQRVPVPEIANQKLEKIIKEIKLAGAGKEYDCIIGVSGGVDSTYVAYLVKEMGLKPLAVHFDNGWNSELAVSNIEKVLKLLDIDLYTYVVDWEEYKDLQLSFLKASTPDGEIPTDHAIYALLYQMANKYGIKYIIKGQNIKTEGILAPSWAKGHLDWKYIKSVQKKFGTKKLKTFPHLSIFKLFYFLWVKQIKSVAILDYANYSKQTAMDVLEKKLGWIYYGGKHYESVYTRFFQGYILPKKFHIDKRRGHLSTLICSGEITREEAIEEIKKDPYPSEELKNQDIEFAAKKLGINKHEFEAIMNSPIRSIDDFSNNTKIIRFLRSIYDSIRKKSIQ
jgi:N-acetyl sugar amidotransferase